MNSDASLVSATEQYVRRTLADNSCGHDWWHIERVRRVALRIADHEPCDRLVVELGALLHDVGDWKFHGGDDRVGPRMTREWLLGCGADVSLADRVARVVEQISYKGAGVADSVDSTEAAIVQDADRLDAIGAIGIGRAFAFGGSRNRPMHDPDQAPTLHATAEAYKSNKGSTINHFHEKLLLLKDRLHTPHARTIAAKRHAFMQSFLEQFQAEWDSAD